MSNSISRPSFSFFTSRIAPMGGMAFVSTLLSTLACSDRPGAVPALKERQAEVGESALGDDLADEATMGMAWSGHFSSDAGLMTDAGLGDAEPIGLEQAVAAHASMSAVDAEFLLAEAAAAPDAAERPRSTCVSSGDSDTLSHAPGDDRPPSSSDLDTPVGGLPGVTPVQTAPPSSSDEVFVPEPGDLRITEVLVNPRGPDAGREWFELQNLSARRLALDGLVVADASRAVALVVPGFLVEPSAHVVLGQRLYPAENGGVPVQAAYGAGLSFNNGGDTLRVCLGACGTGTILDQVTWGALGTAHEGRTLQFALTTGNFECMERDFYGTNGDQGSPGTANPPCA